MRTQDPCKGYGSRERSCGNPLPPMAPSYALCSVCEGERLEVLRESMKAIREMRGKHFPRNLEFEE